MFIYYFAHFYLVLVYLAANTHTHTCKHSLIQASEGYADRFTSRQENLAIRAVYSVEGAKCCYISTVTQYLNFLFICWWHSENIKFPFYHYCCILYYICMYSSMTESRPCQEQSWENIQIVLDFIGSWFSGDLFPGSTHAITLLSNLPSKSH